MLKILYLYFFGYLNIEIEGFWLEKFINLCFSKKIFLWKIETKNSSVITAKVSKNDFEKIEKIANETKCKISVKNKKGIPFILNKYKKRKIFAITLLVIAFFIFGLTRFVWNIDISSNGEINKNEILELLEESGIKKGTLIYKINTDEAINKIRLEREDISWIGIKVLGTKVKVKIVLALENPEITDESEPCNIISDKDGVISKITVQNGTARVKVGDNVKKRRFIS